MSAYADNIKNLKDELYIAWTHHREARLGEPGDEDNQVVVISMKLTSDLHAFLERSEEIARETREKV